MTVARHAEAWAASRHGKAQLEKETREMIEDAQAEETTR